MKYERVGCFETASKNQLGGEVSAPMIVKLVYDGRPKCFRLVSPVSIEKKISVHLFFALRIALSFSQIIYKHTL